MIMTLTNNNVAAVTVDKIRGCIEQTTIAGGGGTATFGVSLADLFAFEDIGDPAWKTLDTLVKKGTVAITFAADANDVNVLDEANEV